MRFQPTAFPFSPGHLADSDVAINPEFPRRRVRRPYGGSPMTSRDSTAATHASPTFRELTPAESRALLGRHNVGRIAYSFHDRVDVQPIHYVVSGDWLYGRTSRGEKFLTLAHNPWCAFEVDEVR